MVHRIDRPHSLRPLAIGRCASVAWPCGADVPELQRHGRHSTATNGQAATWKGTIPFEDDPPRTNAARIRRWLFNRGGMSLVLVLGLILLGLVGGVVSAHG